MGRVIDYWENLPVSLSGSTFSAVVIPESFVFMVAITLDAASQRPFQDSTERATIQRMAARIFNELSRSEWSV